MTRERGARGAAARHRSRSPRRPGTAAALGIAIALTAAVGGVVAASASTLGGVRTDDLGAADATTTAHPSGLSITYTPAWTGSALAVQSITVTAAAGELFAPGEVTEVSVIAANGTRTCALSSTAPGSGTTVAFPAAAVTAACGVVAFSAIDRIAVVSSATVAP